MARQREETPREARHRLRELIQTEGADAAYQALVNVCRDPKAAAPAKATAGTSLLRAGGFFDKNDDDGGKGLSEMSREELRCEIDRIERCMQTPEADGDGDGGGVFE